MKSAAAVTLSALAVLVAGVVGAGALMAAPSVGGDFGGPIDVGSSTGPTPSGGESPRDPAPTPTPAPVPTPTPTATVPPPPSPAPPPPQSGDDGGAVDPAPPVGPQPGDDGDDDGGGDDGDDDGDDDDDDGDDDD